MFGRKRSSEPLPGWSAMTINTLGWPEVERTDRRCAWRYEADVLSLDYFPAEPAIFRPVGDDARLLEYFEHYAGEAGAAVVEARWIAAPDGTPITWSITKAFQSETRHGVVYVGSAIVPFSACSWVAKVQSFEVGTTGVREAVWFSQQMAAGGMTEELISDMKTRSPEDPPPPIRRLPSDDEAWDEMWPGHPLSRVRRLLPQVVASIELSPAAKRLSAFR
jgi:hypothetical protein